MTQYHMFPVVQVLFSPRLSVVISRPIIRLTLLLREIRRWADRPAIVSRNTGLSGRVSDAIKLILPYHHDASGALSSERKA